MRTKEITLEDYLDENLADRTRDKFLALPNFYKSRDGIERYTNIEDAANDIKQEEWIAIARALRDGDACNAGCLLRTSLMRVCERQAEEELEDEFDSGKPQADALADSADYLRQRARDAEFEGSK